MKTEKRKAKVGERIVITNAKPAMGFGQYYSNGDILHVTKTDIYGEGNVGVDEFRGYIREDEYEVIVNEKETEADNVGIIEKMQAEIEELKKRVAALEAQPRTNMPEEVREDLKRRFREKQQKQRDEIIEKAKRDVEELEARLRGDNNRSFVAYVQFFIVSKKRRVIAFIRVKSRFQSVNDKTLSKGIAKCAPDDCFNVHIGKAIALRRALGLEVPDEYLNAPQPTEVRVGDIVKYRNAQRLKTVVTDETPTPLSSDNTRISHARLSVEQFGARIIDDSREKE